MISIYTPSPTPRLRYVAKLLFGVLQQTDWQILDNSEEFMAAQGFKINYSDEDISSNVRWNPHELLNNSEILPHNVSVDSWRDFPILYPSDDPLWPFDLFAATFFLASRYEEYLPHQADSHGRFPADRSIAYQHKFLERPLIDEWAKAFAKVVREQSGIQIAHRRFAAEATFDIDVGWAYRHKGWWRTVAAFGMDVFQGQLKRMGERWSSVAGGGSDPYDTYSYIRAEVENHRVPARFFMLLGDYSKQDRNSSHRLPAMQELIRRLGDFASVGIHPSYGSHKSQNQLEKEISRLADICGTDIRDSRQHYLKMTLPETYRRLIKSGIRRDYTMGYAQHVGFRASLCTPFPFFDLLADRETDLWIYPFAYMDGTLRQYMSLSPDEAVGYVHRLAESVKAVDGYFSCLWHNSSLSNRGEWKGWRKVFESTLKEVGDTNDD